VDQGVRTRFVRSPGWTVARGREPSARRASPLEPRPGGRLVDIAATGFVVEVGTDARQQTFPFGHERRHLVAAARGHALVPGALQDGEVIGHRGRHRVVGPLSDPLDRAPTPAEAHGGHPVTVITFTNGRAGS
jgi:hypothetical protein